MGGFAPAGTVLEVVKEEKDIGVVVSDSLKPSAQCAKAAKKANAILGQMSRAFHYRDETFVSLYKTYVRHHLEFAVQAWSPWFKKDIELLERVQRRAINMVRGLKATSYEGKLHELGLTTLEQRRERGDMIQVWKYLHDQNPGKDNLFEMANAHHIRSSRYTSKPWNICQTFANLEVRKNFFSSRCTEKWNCLPHVVQDAQDLNSFKNKYDTHMLKMNSSL